MARKTKRRVRNYCGCPGVDARTGKIKSGYRASKRGGCPVKVKGAKHPKRAPIQYSTGSGYNRDYEAYRAKQAKEAQWAKSGYPSLGRARLRRKLRR